MNFKALDLSDRVSWKPQFHQIFKIFDQKHLRRRIRNRYKLSSELCKPQWNRYNKFQRDSKPYGISIIESVNQEISLVEGIEFNVINYLNCEFYKYFDGFRVYHGCRIGQIGDESSYRKNGLVILTSERCFEIIKNLKFKSINNRMESTGICFFFEKSSHTEVRFTSNNFLYRGSEMVSCNVDCSDKYKLSSIGTPCIIHCNVPSEFLTEECKQNMFETCIERFFGYENSSGGLQISINLHPKYIIKFEYL